jgi:hypothetical protein
VVGVAGDLKAADDVLGKWQCRDQANQLVVGQVPAAGVREKGAGGGAGVGGWRSVVC